MRKPIPHHIFPLLIWALHVWVRHYKYSERWTFLGTGTFCRARKAHFKHEFMVSWSDSLFVATKNLLSLGRKKTCTLKQLFFFLKEGIIKFYISFFFTSKFLMSKRYNDFYILDVEKTNVFATNWICLVCTNAITY